MAKRTRGQREKIYDRQIVDANYQPTKQECTELSVTCATTGFRVLEQIALAVVASQKQQLMAILPADSDYDRKVIEGHRRAQVCEGLWEEIRREIEKHVSLAREIPELRTQPDPTEAIFENVERDLGLRE